MTTAAPPSPDEVTVQVAVIGGGLSGVCAAIASARLGAATVLVQDRPVLGGNSSSEIRMHICGAASGHHRFGRETGIIEELRLENARRNPYDRPPVWDWILWEFVRRPYGRPYGREPKLSLWLNTRVGEEVELTSDGAINRVLCRQAHTEKVFWLKADLFIDCSGDGELAAHAGAEFRMGREARSEFDESLAPEQADRCVLGSSLMFEVRDVGGPVRFVPPSWAKKFPTDEELPFRHHDLVTGHSGTGLAKGFWWIEFGGRSDTIADDEAIRDELIAVLFGIWDHIKNHGDHGAANYVLDWIGAVPGKRESRRFVGDYVLRQQDIEQQAPFPDRVAYGGWPIDLHPPDGIYSPEPACEQHYPDDFYSIPFRSLYSRNVPNLLFAGRNISASHVALGSTRVMGTCAVLGQAVGTAAALSVRHGVTPRQLGKKHIGELQQQLLHDDCYITGVKRDDPEDLAPRARITASSVRAVEMLSGDAPVAIPPMVAQGFVAAEARVGTVEVCVAATSGAPVPARVRLCRSASLKQYRPEKVLAEAHLTVPAPSIRTPVGAKGPVLKRAGEPRWVRAELGAEVEPGAFYLLELQAENGLVWLATNDELPGTQTVRWDEKEQCWERRRGTFCFRLSPAHRLYSPEYVASGVARPEENPHIWISEKGLPQWLEFEFEEPTTLSEMHVTFDTDLSEKFITATPSTCVKRYRLDWWNGNGPVPEGPVLKREGTRSYAEGVRSYKDKGWQAVFEEANNHQRHHRHTFDPITSTRYRLTVLETWGCEEARIYEVRLYPPSGRVDEGLKPLA